ncbi:nose resistant to fluoxetine protein 6-like [Tachypleus tridentatus]|uniref:nose resistant to fluoxetine protein 6-like n=1 Tax=Tachypleus tridentatus TaxID=6853 RepID=UPI003FD2636F
MIRTTSSANLSGSCYSNMLKMLLGVRSLKAWAFRMLDASAKFGSGILDGVTTDFGAYEQCLNIIVLNKRSKKEDFRGKYCTMKINPNFPAPSAPLDPRLHDTVFGEIKEALTFLSSLNYFVGLCIPSTCSTEDAEKLAKAALQDIVQVAVPHCEIKTETKLNAEQIGVLSIHGTLILLVIIGTTLDLWKQYQPKKNTNESKTSKPWKENILDIFKSFSLYTNVKQLLNTKVGSGNLGVLHGFRFFTMCWVILAHTYMFPDFNFYSRLTDFRDAGKNISFLVVWNSWLQVDTFFFITGVTLTYTTLRKLERTNGRLDLVRYVVHRYWRLTPPLMLVISFMFLLPLISSGPFWTKFVEPQIQNCRDTWWANMFYFTNFIGSEKQCITPYWYLAADMQLYLISPIVLISFYRWPRIGMCLTIFGVLASCISVGAVTYWMDFTPSIVFFDVERVRDMNDYIHYMPYIHLSPYCIGLTMGYILLKYKNVKMKPATVIMGWIVTTISCAAVIFGAYDWINGVTPNVVIGLLYASVHRSVFALGLAWITFASVNGYGGPVNAFLSWKPL